MCFSLHLKLHCTSGGSPQSTIHFIRTRYLWKKGRNCTANRRFDKGNKIKKNLQSVLQLSAVLYHTSLKTTASGTIQFSYIEKLTTVYINLVTAAIREIRL